MCKFKIRAVGMEIARANQIVKKCVNLNFNCYVKLVYKQMKKMYIYSVFTLVCPVSHTVSAYNVRRDDSRHGAAFDEGNASSHEAEKEARQDADQRILIAS